MRFPYTGSGIALVCNGRVLLGKRSVKLFNGLWCVPGGGRQKNKGETDFECACREFFEETGVKIEAFSPKTVGKWTLCVPFFSWTTYFCVTDVFSEDFKPDEFSELRWLRFDELKNYRLRPFGKTEMRKLKKIFGK